MTQYLPSSGTIGLGMARNQWNQENSPSPVSTISLGGSPCRSLAGKYSGPVKMSDLYAKYRGWKMQVFSYPAHSSLHTSAESDGGEGDIYYPAKTYGGDFVGIGAYQRSVVNKLFPYHTVATYTLNLGNITPARFGNISLLFFGYIRPWSTWYDRKWDMTGICIRIEGMPMPEMRTYSWGGYSYYSVYDNKYPTYLSLSYRRNGGPVTKWPHVIRKTGTGTDRSQYILVNPAPKGTVPNGWVLTYYRAYDGGVWTNAEDGNLGLTCNDAGQPGGNAMWYVPYYSNRVNFNVGDQVEIVDISYWW